MIQARPPQPPTRDIVYPDSDGEPLADNTLQLQWIVVLYDNLCALFRDRSDVFVGANQLWYPVPSEEQSPCAPDVYVVFGRPKGYRGSYKQWEEDNIPMTVTMEVLSPENDRFEMADKLAFYDEHGVEEYYVYDPDQNKLLVYLRQGQVLRRIWKASGFISPRLGIRFEITASELVVYHPDGRRFQTFAEITAAWEKDRAENSALKGELTLERQRAEAERQRAEAERQRAEAEQQRRVAAEHRLARMVELTRKLRLGQVNPEEVAELERLEQEA